MPQGGKPQDDWATLDHLRCRLHPQRNEPNHNGEERTVLACWKCNNERNKEEMKIAGLEVLQQKSDSPPASKDKLVEVIQYQQKVISKLKKALVKNGLRKVYNAVITKAAAQRQGKTGHGDKASSQPTMATDSTPQSQ